jgi:hypothetical protein
MSTHTTPAVMAVAVTALALASCGGGEGSGGGGASDREKMEEYALKSARCMREHGIDVPDPKPGQGMVINGDIANPEQFDRARRACEKKLGKPPVPELSEEDQREFRDAALKHARCMREHGIDFPDPTFGPNGEARIELRREDGGPGPDDPAFKAADAACRKYLGRGAFTRSAGPGQAGGTGE